MKKVFTLILIISSFLIQNLSAVDTQTICQFDTVYLSLYSSTISYNNIVQWEELISPGAWSVIGTGDTGIINLINDSVEVRVFFNDYYGAVYCSDTLMIYADTTGDCYQGPQWVNINYNQPIVNATICSGDTIDLELPYVDDQVEIQWQYFNNTKWVNMPGDTFSDLGISPTASYLYRAHLTEGCYNQFCDTFRIAVKKSGCTPVPDSQIYYMNLQQYPLTLESWPYLYCDSTTGNIWMYADYGANSYQFSIDNGQTYVSDTGYYNSQYYFTGLTLGNTYITTVKDTEGCVVRDTVYLQNISIVPDMPGIPQGPTLVSNTDIYSEYNLNDNRFDYDYQWEVIPGGDTNSIYYDYTVADVYWDSTFTGIANIRVSGLNECGQNGPWSEPLQVKVIAPILLQVTATNSICSDSSGSAYVTVYNAASPFHYLWSTGDKGDSIVDVPAGIYIVTITDADSNSVFQAIVISNENGPQISVDTSSNLSMNCYSSQNGSIQITVAGGYPTYSYVWSNGATTQNLSGLSAGPYNVEVKDSRGCSGFQNVVITSPAQITLRVTAADASCGNTDGSTTLNVSGGVVPYTYSWSDGTSDSTLSDAGAGTYSVLVTDNNSCMDSTKILINNPTGPKISLDTIKNAICGSHTGSIMITAMGGNTPYSFLWSNGAKTEDLTDVVAGTYSVTVTDKSGCIGTLNAEITKSTPVNQTICMVSVDSLLGKNKIIWNKDSISGVAAYNIYKETTEANVYKKIATVPVDAPSSYVDTLSNPLQRAWRYEISTVDSCGVESPLSAAHKTIHLSVIIGLDNVVNLIWDNYEGFSYDTYVILRKVEFKNWTLYDSVPSDDNSYTDDTIENVNTKYAVIVRNPNNCWISDGVLKINEGPYSASISNLEDNRMKADAGNSLITEKLTSLSVYPNPFSTSATLKYELLNTSNIQIELYDELGVKIKELQNATLGAGAYQLTINSEDLHASGLYYIRIIADKQSIALKLWYLRNPTSL